MRMFARMFGALGLCLALAVSLSACGALGTLSSLLAAPGVTAKACTAWETPRAYVDCIAQDLAQLARDYEADSRGGLMTRETFLAAEPYVLEARKALNDSGALLAMAATTRDQAVAAGEGTSKAGALNTAAAGVEAAAIARAAVAEDRVKWLKDNLARSRAPPTPSLAPAGLSPAGLAPITITPPSS